MQIDLSTLSSNAVYHLMTQTIIPRPIAWVLSANTNSKDTPENYNLAPFSYFNAVCSDPPLVMLSMGYKPSGELKDTARNLSVGAHCVVHIAHTDQSDAVTATAASLEYGQSEITANQLALTSQADWNLPRLSDAKIAYFCEVHSRQEIGNSTQQIIFVEAKQVWINDEAIVADSDRLQIDAQTLNPLARLGANQYANLGDVFSKNRPK